jgi:hypothetical protein
MTLVEKHYYAERPEPDNYDSLNVIQHLADDSIQFQLMATRWRSIEEAADYLRWAATELEKLNGSDSPE